MPKQTRHASPVCAGLERKQKERWRFATQVARRTCKHTYRKGRSHTRYVDSATALAMCFRACVCENRLLGSSHYTFTRASESRRRKKEVELRRRERTRSVGLVVLSCRVACTCTRQGALDLPHLSLSFSLSLHLVLMMCCFAFVSVNSLSLFFSLSPCLFSSLPVVYLPRTVEPTYTHIHTHSKK